jgi:hypothetical protein
VAINQEDAEEDLEADQEVVEEEEVEEEEAFSSIIISQVNLFIT